MNTTLTPAIAQLAAKASQIQDACNIGGVSLELERASQILAGEIGRGEVRRHFVVIAILDKLASLAGVQFETDGDPFFDEMAGAGEYEQAVTVLREVVKAAFALSFEGKLNGTDAINTHPHVQIAVRNLQNLVPSSFGAIVEAHGLCG